MGHVVVQGDAVRARPARRADRLGPGGCRSARQAREHRLLEARQRGDRLGEETVGPGRDRRALGAGVAARCRAAPARAGAPRASSSIRSMPDPSGRPSRRSRPRAGRPAGAAARPRRLSARRMRAPVRRQSSRIASQAKRLSSTTSTVSPSSGPAGGGQAGGGGKRVRIVHGSFLSADSPTLGRGSANDGLMAAPPLVARHAPATP